MKNTRKVQVMFASVVVASGFTAMICVAIDSTPLPDPMPSATELAAPYPMANRLGLSEAALAMAGVQPAGANVILSHLIEQDPLRQAIADQITAIDQGAAAAVACTVAMSVDPTDQEAAADLSQALLQVQLADGQLQSLEQQLLTAVAGELSSAQLVLIERVRSSLHNGTPAEYCAVDRSAEEWHRLRRALRAEQRAVRLGESLDSGLAQYLAEVRSDQAFIEAQLALEMGLPALTQAFDLAL